MNRVRTKSWFVPAGLLFTCLTAATAAAKVVVSFTGVVDDVTGFGASPPAGVSVGQSVSGTVSYVPASAQGFEVGPSEKSYGFIPDGVNVVRITIGSQTWTTSLVSVGVCDGVCGGDNLNFGGVATPSSIFPGLLDEGVMVLDYTDSAEPFGMVNGTDLPDAAEDVQFGEADGRLGSISSTSGAAGLWIITFTTDTSTLPVQGTTWSQVKQLFAR